MGLLIFYEFDLLNSFNLDEYDYKFVESPANQKENK